MTSTLALGVARADHSQTTLVHADLGPLTPGQVRLKVDRVGLTANNVTYAVLGDSLRYWEFFPPAGYGLGPEWGLVPVWGFAEVVESTVEALRTGGRYYGYYPMAGHLTVQPGRIDARGFRDISEHRASLPTPYNVYAVTTGDPAYRAEQEDLLILYRPLYFTSFMLADYLADNEYFGATSLVFSSASSKTAYGTAFELHGRGPRLIGVTSPDNVEFTAGLGYYNTVLPYSTVDAIDSHEKIGLVDFAGDGRLRDAIRQRFGANLVYDGSVGLTHHTAGGTQTLSGDVFFAPDQMRKRGQDWGREGLDNRFAEAWSRFSATVEGWVDVRVGRGPQALRTAWLELLGGQTAPRTGKVIAL